MYERRKSIPSTDFGFSVTAFDWDQMFSFHLILTEYILQQKKLRFLATAWHLMYLFSFLFRRHSNDAYLPFSLRKKWIAFNLLYPMFNI